MVTPDFELSSVLAEFNERSPSGYAMGLHVTFTTPAYFFQSYPRPWLEHYNSAGLLMNDPTVSWCFENTGVSRWSDLDDPAGVLVQAADFGMKFGIVYATTSGGSLSMSGFARPDREYTQDEIDELVERYEALHRATQDKSALSPETVDQLKKMSILVTHPGS